MLKPIEHIIKNPNDVPDVPRATKEYLQSRFNAEYFYLNEYKRLRERGHSEEFIAGVLFGFHMASMVIDEIEHRKQMNQGD